MTNEPKYGPVFLCGLPRSGNHWLSHTLSQSNELTFVQQAWLLLRLHELVDWYEKVLSDWPPITTWHESGINRKEFVQRVGNFYDQLLREASGGRRYLEVTPSWNATSLDLLSEMMPHASFIVLLRDGRNQVASLEAFNHKNGLMFDFEQACRKWARAMDTISKTVSRENDDRILPVRYEDCVEDFDNVFEAICRFLNIGNFKPDAMPSNTAFEGPDQNQYNFRWSAWDEGRKQVFKATAGKQLVEWGYVDSTDW